LYGGDAILEEGARQAIDVCRPRVRNPFRILANGTKRFSRHKNASGPPAFDASLA